MYCVVRYTYQENSEVNNMNLDKWKSQIVRGTLEYCILLMLDKKVYYGYEILQELSKYPIITSTESTVYPLLRRLQKENYLQSTWQESTEGRSEEHTSELQSR